MSGIDSYTKIMLHFDGSDASTTITDSSLSPKTWTANGNAQLDTAIKKFGTAGLLCDGTGDYVDTPDSTDFVLSNGSWTVDFWFNTSGGAGTNRRIFGHVESDDSIPGSSVFGGVNTSNKLSCQVCSGVVSQTIASTTTIAINTWYHGALVRDGNTLRLFLDGVQEASVAYTLTLNNPAAKFAVGRRGEVTTSPFLGTIDEFRLSVGIARWTANFTPPSAAYATDETIAGGLFTDTQTFFAAQMVVSQTITAQLYTNAQSFFGATLGAVTSIVAALVTNAQTFYGASLLPVQAIMASRFTESQTFFSAYLERDADPPGPVEDIYRKTSASKVAFWNAVRASKFRSRN